MNKPKRKTRHNHISETDAIIDILNAAERYTDRITSIPKSEISTDQILRLMHQKYPSTCMKLIYAITRRKVKAKNKEARAAAKKRKARRSKK